MQIACGLNRLILSIGRSTVPLKEDRHLILHADAVCKLVSGFDKAQASHIIEKLPCAAQIKQTLRAYEQSRSGVHEFFMPADAKAE